MKYTTVLPEKIRTSENKLQIENDITHDILYT